MAEGCQLLEPGGHHPGGMGFARLGQGTAGSGAGCHGSATVSAQFGAQGAFQQLLK